MNDRIFFGNDAHIYTRKPEKVLRRLDLWVAVIVSYRIEIVTGARQS